MRDSAEQSIIRLIGAVLLKQNDEWKTQHCYMEVEGMTGLVSPTIAGEATPLPSAQNTPKAACPMNTSTYTEITPA